MKNGWSIKYVKSNYGFLNSCQMSNAIVPVANGCMCAH